MHLKSPTHNHLTTKKKPTHALTSDTNVAYSRKTEGRCWSEAIGSSTGLLPAVTLVLRSHTYHCTPYTNLFLVAGATTTALTFMSTRSSPPTPFYHCRRYFWILTTSGTSLYSDIIFPMLSISLRDFIHHVSVSAGRVHGSVHSWCSSHPSPACLCKLRLQEQRRESHPTAILLYTRASTGCAFSSISTSYSPRRSSSTAMPPLLTPWIHLHRPAEPSVSWREGEHPLQQDL